MTKIWKWHLIQKNSDLFFFPSDFINLPNKVLCEEKIPDHTLHSLVSFLFFHLGQLLGLGLLWRWYLWRAQGKHYVDCPSRWGSHTIDSGFLFWAGIPQKALLYPVTRYVTFDHLTEGVSARFLPYEVTVFPFAMSQYIVERCLETM